MTIVEILLVVVVFAGQVCVFLLHRKEMRRRESPFYTDYTHGNLTLRVFKPEFEYQAFKGVPRGRLLDRGTLSPLYDWILIGKN